MASVPSTAAGPRERRFPPLFWITIASKVALVALLIFAVVRDDLPQFQGKAMEGRALLYPISILVVPIGYWLVRRKRAIAGGYPYGLDILLGLPFLIDVGGNALNLYDTIEWWDDLNHLVNWGILSAAFGQFLLRLPVGKLSTAGLVAGFGAITAILWELAEYITFVRNSPELQTAYTDTLGDLVLGTLGSIIAGIVTAWVLWPKRGLGARG